MESINKARKVILDTNFLLIPAQFGLDIFQDIERICDFRPEILVFDKSMDEIDNIIKKQKGKAREAAKIALNLVKIQQNNKKINIIPAKTGYIDREILDFTQKEPKTAIATQDLALRKKLREKGIKTIIMRQKSHLEFED